MDQRKKGRTNGWMGGKKKGKEEGMEGRGKEEDKCVMEGLQ